MAPSVERTQLVAFVLLIVLAVAVGNLIQALGVLPLRDTGGGNTIPRSPLPSSPFNISPEAVQVIVVALMATGAVAVLWLLIQAARHGRGIRLLPSAFSNNVFVFALMALLLSIVALLLTRSRNTPLLGGNQESEMPLVPAPYVQPPGLVPPNFPLGLLLLVGAMGVLLALALVRGAYARPRPASSPGPRREVAQEVAHAADVLQGGGDFRGTILRCYVNTCRLLALKGAPSDAALTAREFEEGARPLLGLSEGSLGRLTNLFEVARYSPHPVGPMERDDAVACLRAIQGELGG